MKRDPAGGSPAGGGRHDARPKVPEAPVRPERRTPDQPIEPRMPGNAAAWAAGLLLLAALTAVLLTGLAWPLKVAAWVLLTLLLDEAGGWFGYAGAALGAVPLWVTPMLLAGPDAPLTAGWDVLFGLVFSGLVAMLLVKHAGGPLAALLSLAAFAVPVVGAHVAGPFLDDRVTLPLDPAFLPFTLGPAAVGAAVAFVRSLVSRRRRAPAAVTSAA